MCLVEQFWQAWWQFKRFSTYQHVKLFNIHNTFLKYSFKIARKGMPHATLNRKHLQIPFKFKERKKSFKSRMRYDAPTGDNIKTTPPWQPPPLRMRHSNSRCRYACWFESNVCALITVPKMQNFIPTVKEMDHLDIVCETQLTKNTNLGNIKNRIWMIEHLHAD